MKLDHFVLLAADIERSARFYDAVLPVLGFRKTRDWVWASEDGFAVDLRQAGSGPGYRRHGPGLNHFGFTVETRSDFDAALIALKKAGVDVPPVQEFGEALAVFLPDPDGLRIEIGWEPNSSRIPAS